MSPRVLPALGFDDGFFNVEFFVPEEGPAQIIEVNGRIASQFAPLVQGLHGRSTYDALFQLALGEDPDWEPGEPDGVAVSYVLRVFEDAFVEAVPDPEPDLEVLVRPGLSLSEQGVNDAQSYRLAILYGFGETREEAVARCRERARGAQLPAGAGACSLTGGAAPPRLAVRDPEGADRRAGEGERGGDDHARPEPGHRGVSQLLRGLVLRERHGAPDVGLESKTSVITSPITATAMRLPRRETVELTPEAMPA